MGKKLAIKKQTIVRLQPWLLNEVKAGVSIDTCASAESCLNLIPCWENLWTIYKCTLIGTTTEPA